MKGFCLEVSGPYACFTRPEMKVERVSYDVITPSAARAIFEAIFWKPAIRWQVRKIEVLNPVKWISVHRNEIAAIARELNKQLFIEDNRQQRSGLFLRDVRYRLYAELVFIPLGKRAAVTRSAGFDHVGRLVRDLLILADLAGFVAVLGALRARVTVHW